MLYLVIPKLISNPIWTANSYQNTSTTSGCFLPSFASYKKPYPVLETNAKISFTAKLNKQSKQLMTKNIYKKVKKIDSDQKYSA